MTRYIDANEALRMIRNSEHDNPYDPPKKGVWEIAHDCCISCVDAVPTADVVEVKRGCWIVDKERQILRVRHTKPIRSLAYKCSECGCKSGNNKYLKYCHGCGAKMDGGNAE